MAAFTRVTVGVMPTLIAAANGNRRAFFLKNIGANSVFLGDNPSVSVATGFELLALQQISVDGDVDAWWGIVTMGTVDVDVLETL